MYTIKFSDGVEYSTIFINDIKELKCYEIFKNIFTIKLGNTIIYKNVSKKKKNQIIKEWNEWHNYD